MNDAEWTTNWPAFVSVLSEHLSSGTGQDELTALFAGRRVCWEGTLRGFDSSKWTSGVVIDMPAQTLVLSDNNQIRMRGLSASIAASDLSQWQNVNIGDTVFFSAMFRDASAIFPCIQIEILSTGKRIIMLGLRDARLLSCD